MGSRKHQYLEVSKRQETSKESSGMGKNQENLVSMILMEVHFKKERKNEQNKVIHQGAAWWPLVLSLEAITTQSDSGGNQSWVKRGEIKGDDGGGGKKKVGL